MRCKTQAGLVLAQPLAQPCASMAWIYEKSATWRKMVKLSKQSSLYTAIFGVAFVGIPYGVGKLVMWGTNPEVISPERQRQLDAQRTVDHKVCLRRMPKHPRPVRNLLIVRLSLFCSCWHA